MMRTDKEEASFDEFFDASKASLSVAIVSLRAASESDQSGGGTEDNPVGLVMLGAAYPPPTPTTQTTAY